MKQNKILIFAILSVVIMLSILSLGFVSAAQATPLNLGTAEHFAALSKVQVDSSAGATTVVGDVGVSPAAHTFLTGFSLIGDETTDAFLTSAQVTGKLYSANLQPPTPTEMTTSISDMELAYTQALDTTANPAGVGTFLDLGAGTIIAQTLTPGVYTWGTSVDIIDDLTLDCLGNTSEAFVFQIAGNLEIDAGKQIILSGSCQNNNIFWAVAGTTDLLAGSHFEGTILGGPATSEITMITGSTINGRLLGEKTISLQATTSITLPGVMPGSSGVTNDDTANTVTGMATGMEYNLDNATNYTAYDVLTFPTDFSGDHTLLVRIAAVGLNPAGADTVLTFTTNPTPATTTSGSGSSHRGSSDGYFVTNNAPATETPTSGTTNPPIDTTENGGNGAPITGGVIGAIKDVGTRTWVVVGIIAASIVGFVVFLFRRL